MARQFVHDDLEKENGLPRTKVTPSAALSSYVNTTGSRAKSSTPSGEQRRAKNRVVLGELTVAEVQERSAPANYNGINEIRNEDVRSPATSMVTVLNDLRRVRRIQHGVRDNYNDIGNTNGEQTRRRNKKYATHLSIR